MMMKIAPLARLISRHGAEISLHRTPAADATKPWQIDTQTPAPVAIKGLIQRLRPTPDPDLPQGSIRAIAVMVLPRGVMRPHPGDRVTALERDWRIETILPVTQQRGTEVMEAVIVSPGVAS